MSGNDSVVGRVTARAWSPFLERGIGYVRMAEPGEWVGSKFRGEDDRPFDVLALPFYDAERVIPRGLVT